MGGCGMREHFLSLYRKAFVQPPDQISLGPRVSIQGVKHVTDLKARVNEAHVLLNGVIEGWARHATTPQHSHGLITATPMVHHFTPREHVCLAEKAADVC